MRSEFEESTIKNAIDKFDESLPYGLLSAFHFVNQMKYTIQG